ncbi:MAG: tyrosine-type recombinase/integrase [Thiohalocapsa sp.]|jgi:integrase
MYLEKRRRKWHALQDVPPSAREGLGGRRRFVKSLQTEDYQEAKRRAAVWEQRWALQIAQAKDRTSNPAERDADYWRQMYDSCTSDVERELVEDSLIVHLDRQLEQIAQRQGFKGNPRDLPEAEDAVRTYKVATGQLTRTSDRVEEWLATKDHLQPKTLQMYRSDLRRLSERFPLLQDITKAEVTTWITKELLQQEGLNRKTLDRLLPACRGYWQYLQDLGLVADDQEPFSRLSVQQNGAKKVHPRDKRKDYTADEAHRLLDEAVAKDPSLADLIRLGMWTGARISELCHLKVADVHLDVPLPHFKVEDSKTPAGVRTVPVHPELRSILKRLLKTSDDGYVLSGLTPNKYGDRSNAIGKRFGRLKTSLGFSRQHGFHTFRHTVITRLLNADVPYPVVAAIVGHDTGENVTLGVYAKGFDLEVLTKALKKLEYPRVPAQSS